VREIPCIGGKELARIPQAPDGDAQTMTALLVSPVHLPRAPQRLVVQAIEGIVESQASDAKVESSREECLEFGTFQYSTALCLRRALLRPASSEPRDEHVPVPRLAERQGELAQSPVEGPKPEDAEDRSQAADADAQLMEVFGVSPLDRPADIRRDLRQRGVNENATSLCRRALDSRLFPPTREFGVTDGTRTRNNWNHNPGLYR
jgi:hypothetical protein